VLPVPSLPDDPVDDDEDDDPVDDDPVDDEDDDDDEDGDPVDGDPVDGDPELLEPLSEPLHADRAAMAMKTKMLRDMGVPPRVRAGGLARHEEEGAPGGATTAPSARASPAPKASLRAEGLRP